MRETYGHLHFCLKAILKCTPEGIIHRDIDLGAIEGTITWVGDEGRAQSERGSLDR